MDLDLHLDLMEFTGRLIGFPLVNGVYFGIVSLFSLFTSSGKPWAKGGVLTRDLARWLGAGGLGHEAGGLWPPLASPAPTSLACPHQPCLPPWASPAPMLRRRPSSGTGTRLRAPVVILGFGEYGLFSVYKSSVFSSLVSIDN